ncbi:aminoglycoside phosphotransferase family protein [Paenibacillus harenae]|uniref:aminoglycoside phosphotransferase family protein n=1 Tax=Paenibacillus harenae TaxID=306543 RepID=UPI002790C980|nr:aminoglycoside phosphotransferase family protein [Paenibacillus harenae]MDQ0060069.1 fructosamine-3-kinase [Paenibacillus harenae]
MEDLIRNVDWLEKSKAADSLLDNSSSITLMPLDAGLEAEVTKICSGDSSYVLKVWNRSSKPNVGNQYRLLEALYNQGIPVSQPLGWGIDKEMNQVLLTSYDGTPIRKVNQSSLKKLAKILSSIHSYPLENLDASILQSYDFVGYFYPSIEEHLDIKDLLNKLLERSSFKQGALIHGDYNLGNILVNEGKYTIIDWTNGQLGDPRYDLAWSVVLIRIYVGERHGSVYESACLTESGFTKEELELFEAIACLRWILLNRIADDLPRGKDTLVRVKSILKNNVYLDESLLIEVKK